MTDISSPNERSVRIKRLQKIKKRGIDPYPARTKRTHTVGEVVSDFAHLKKSNSLVSIAGRLQALREHGGSTFADLSDGSATIQVYFKKDELKSKKGLGYDDFLAFVDLGDFIEVSGSAFLTQKKEKTILAGEWGILTKAIRPIPSKWYGIKDKEARYRKRYLDMLLNPSLKALFVRKARFWNSMREFLVSEEFVEVYTPVLENTTGGADATPFVTHHNALDIDVYLRISMGELWQKRLMVAGFPKTFEIGRQFRNEGISPEHLQDYMQMEYYWAYADYEMGMEFTARLIRHVAQETFGTLKFHINGMDVDLEGEWGTIDFVEHIHQKTGIDVGVATLGDIKKKLDQLGVTYLPGLGKGRLMDALWKYCRKHIVGPVFLINTPVEISPLSKRNPENSRVTERFQLIFAGSEHCNGYSELNDPLDQGERFKQQGKLREQGDQEAQMNDEDFVEALEYGMPPVCGLGISERLFSFLEDKSIRECVMFPLLRPEGKAKDRDHKERRVTHGAKTNNVRGSGKEEKIKDLGITRDEAVALLRSHIKNENLIRHHYAVEVQMRALAEHFINQGVKNINPDAWGLTGLLHDMDWEETENDPGRHSLVTEEILNKKNVHPAMVNAIKVHNHIHGFRPQTLMEKALYCAEGLTGLVVAAALVQPDKKLANVETKSVIKKFKDKSFARGVNRDIILKCKEFLGMELDELVLITITAMQGIAHDLGL